MKARPGIPHLAHDEWLRRPNNLEASAGHHIDVADESGGGA
ncbi:hypothetical protein [Streptomyces rishiriensis]|nr:hypothetical protein [Streptomyces rishiriensis]